MKPSNNILLVLLFANGDCLYATAVARQIKQDYPNCLLTWAIAPSCKNIISENPYVDEILSVEGIKINDIAAIRKFKKEVFRQKNQGHYKEVFFVQNADTNQAYYDGCIRSSIFRAYSHPITVPVTPVLKLREEEREKAKQFAEIHNLLNFSSVILFEYAPQSGQSKLTKEMAVSIAEGIVAHSNTAIILSSANKINHVNKAIIDGSSLTLRETAAVTHYCSLLLGTSSGITWISTSSAAKFLPMVQIFNPNAAFENPISRDFERFKISTEKVIELLRLDEALIIACVRLAIQDFKKAKNKFNQPIPLHFKTTRNIVYNLLCYLEFKAILKHIQVNREVYGNNMSFYKEVFLGFLFFPFKLIKNFATKKRLKK